MVERDRYERRYDLLKRSLELRHQTEMNGLKFRVSRSILYETDKILYIAESLDEDTAGLLRSVVENIRRSV
jgi:hypothetical protein